MARTIRNSTNRKFDDDQEFQNNTGKKKRHANNHTTGGIRPTRFIDELELDPEWTFDQFGVRIRLT